MITINTLSLTDCSKLSANQAEAMRYLGVKDPDTALVELYQKCEKEIYDIASPKAVYIKSDITLDCDAVDFGFMRVQSKNLAKNLCGCKEAYVFCATLGIGLDRHFEKLSAISQSRATVFSATASSLIESFCGYVNKELVGQKESRPRFSCGYGDFSIEHQVDILKVLEADKRLGVYLTDSFMMVPVKTVTAIIGIRS